MRKRTNSVVNVRNFGLVSVLYDLGSCLFVFSSFGTQFPSSADGFQIFLSCRSFCRTQTYDKSSFFVVLPASTQGERTEDRGAVRHSPRELFAFPSYEKSAFL